jgi:gliding motility-associated-like protein
MVRFYCLAFTLLFASFSFVGFSQKAKDGVETFSNGQYVLNRYAALVANANAGDLFITVDDINKLSGSAPGIANSFNPYANDGINTGDLFLIIQIQGATINSDNGSTYGNIIDYAGTGNYELKEVSTVSGNRINFCPGLLNAYGANITRKTMVVRVPRLSTLTINNGATLSAIAWNGQTGGAVVVEVDGDITINGLINASGLGFRGGQAVPKDGEFGISDYRTNVLKNGSEKGESIAGDVTIYQSLYGGALAKGSPANGGGGGNGHNSGGGGGSNAGINDVINGWNGTGVKENRTTPTNWTAAWNLESPGFANNISPGGGRGGYTYSTGEQDAITQGPNNAAWQGDNRRNEGGFGGRPLDYSSKRKLFFGGGGGAGDGNNLSAGSGGNGGGIVLLISFGNIGGIGSILSNGAAGDDTKFEHRDAAGGGGGGGAIVLLAKNMLNGINVFADGGRGGSQLNQGPYIVKEAEGPGGGGGGGYIGTTASTGISTSVKGALGGKSGSRNVTEFEPNGATGGANGSFTSVDFINYATNNFNKLIDTTICTGQSYVLPDGTVATQSIQKSFIFKSNQGCDSVITVNLKVLPSLTSTVFPQICPGERYLLPFSNPPAYVTAAGEYRNTGKSVSGCDSTVISKLTVTDTISQKVFKTICKGASYTLPNGQVVSTSGTYPVKFKTINNCDSAITTILNVTDSILITIPEFVCKRKGFKLPDGRVVTTSGDYEFRYKSAAGCDSIIVYEVALLPNQTDSIEVSICKDSSYRLPNDSLVRTSGIYTVILPAVNRCDSIITVKVNVSTGNNDVIQMPTVFTPNGDGLNDILKIPTIQKDRLEFFSIYDRWGNLLFKTTSADVGWDGRFKNTAMPIGVYVYILSVKDCTKKSKLYKGTVGIVK